MPRKTPYKLHQVMFRLSQKHIEQLEAIAKLLADEHQAPMSRADALRHLLDSHPVQTKPAAPRGPRRAP